MFAEQPEVSLLASLHLTIYTRYSNTVRFVNASRILRVPLDSHHKPQPNKEDNNNNKTISKLEDKKKRTHSQASFGHAKVASASLPNLSSNKGKKKKNERILPSIWTRD